MTLRTACGGSPSRVARRIGAREGATRGKTHRVGLLSIGTDLEESPRQKPFFDAMRELNYVEGRNLSSHAGLATANSSAFPH
jgi:hypothetical protein